MVAKISEFNNFPVCFLRFQVLIEQKGIIFSSFHRKIIEPAAFIRNVPESDTGDNIFIIAEQCISIPFAFA